MYNILTLNKIAAIGTSRLGDNYKYGDDVQNPDAVLVRSAAMHDMEFADNLLAIARAGAGTNNIPKDKCSEQGIVVFNTPGANANAVKELVIAGLLISNRKVIEGYEWAKTLKGNGAAVGKMVEKGKSQFVGPEIKGKTLGVIGLGAIGILVANAAVALGMNVIGFDPFMSVGNALKLAPTVKLMKSAEDVMVNCDYLTIHVPLTDDTRDMVDADMIAKMKDGVRILNFSRDGLVNSTAVLEAVKSGKVAKYVTDFGTDGIKPLAKICDSDDKGIFVLVKTSNPSSGELQDMKLETNESVYEHMGKMCEGWGEDLMGKHGYSAVGAVVGATYPEQLGEMRAKLPHTFFLVPGYGAQGGGADDVKNAFDENGLGAIINSSRGIMCAWKKQGLTEDDFAVAARKEAERMRDEIVGCIGKIKLG